METEKSLFNSESDRQLWIKLNAERQIVWEKGLTYFNKKTGKYEPTLQALNPRSIEEAIEVSVCQCKIDEKNGKLRYTLEELLTLDKDGIDEVDRKRQAEWIKKFEAL